MLIEKSSKPKETMKTIEKKLCVFISMVSWQGNRCVANGIYGDERIKNHRHNSKIDNFSIRLPQLSHSSSYRMFPVMRFKIVGMPRKFKVPNVYLILSSLYERFLQWNTHETWPELAFTVLSFSLQCWRYHRWIISTTSKLPFNDAKIQIPRHNTVVLY